jgi:hypothetical protein
MTISTKSPWRYVLNPHMSVEILPNSFLEAAGAGLASSCRASTTGEVSRAFKHVVKHLIEH